jgi:PAS domain-containing protein
MSEDISERKNAQERLRQSEEKYRLLFERAQYPSYITSKDGNIAEVNAAALDLWRSSLREVIGVDSSRLILHPACITILGIPNGPPQSVIKLH